jgi:hypothetical protein
MKIPQFDCSGPDYGYHGTTLKNIPIIKRNGLIPSIGAHEDEERGVDEPAIFFSVKPTGALIWGPILLRFPWPAEAYEDPYGDTIVLCGEVVATNWWTPELIEPEDIEIWYRKKWRKLVK